eukprot:113320_1
MGITADYKSLKNTIKHKLHIQSQEIAQFIKLINDSIKCTVKDGHFIQSIPITNTNRNNISNSISNSIIEERDELKSNLLQLNIAYQNEKKLRKKLLEEVIDLKGNIRVFCRVRPKIKRAI